MKPGCAKLPVMSLLSVLALIASSAVGAQQLYKWVGADGKINYSDIAPPSSARRAETKEPVGVSSNSPALPYELAQAARTSPVVLYTMSPCLPCDNARALLSRRGIPFTEKTVTTAGDSERMKQAGGDGTMPMLLVGRARELGFDPAVWGTRLSAAGYPESSRLPAGYRNAPPAPAEPVAATEAATEAAGKANGAGPGNAPQPAAVPANRPPPASEKTVPGFRF